jgi:hypothetical protein
MTRDIFRTYSRAALVFAALLTLGADILHAQQDKKEQVDLATRFTPSGWMGDGEYGRKYIDFEGADIKNPHSPPHAIRVTYTFGPKRWAGLYWQNLPDNWGDKPGEDFSGKGFSQISFWARGATGGEVVEFKAGGVDAQGKKHRDSFAATSGRINLGKEWKRYAIDLRKRDLRGVIGGFCWAASADYNSEPSITFYIDDVVLE